MYNSSANNNLNYILNNSVPFNQNLYPDNFNNQIQNFPNGFNNNSYQNNNFAHTNNNINPYSNSANFAPNFIPNGESNNNFSPMMDNNNNYTAANNNMILNANQAIGDLYNPNPQNLPQNLNNSYAPSTLLNNLANNALQLNNLNNQSGNLFDNFGSDDKKKKPVNDEYKKSLLEQIEIRRRTNIFHY